MKRFIVPALIVVEAEDVDAADFIAGEMQTAANHGMVHGTYMLLDEHLPTVDITDADYDEIFSVLDAFEIDKLPEPRTF